MRIETYRRRTHIDLEAVQLTKENAVEVANWCGGNLVKEYTSEDEYMVGLNIPTLDGPIRASQDDFVIRLPTGAFTKMHLGEFYQNWEKVMR